MLTGQFIKNHKCIDYIMLIQNINIVSFMMIFFGIYSFFCQITGAHSFILYSQNSKIFLHEVLSKTEGKK